MEQVGFAVLLELKVRDVLLSAVSYPQECDQWAKQRSQVMIQLMANLTVAGPADQVVCCPDTPDACRKDMPFGSLCRFRHLREAPATEKAILLLIRHNIFCHTLLDVDFITK